MTGLQSNPAGTGASPPAGLIASRKFNRLVSTDEVARSAWKWRIKNEISVRTGQSKRAQELVEKLVGNAEANLEGLALVLYGPSGAGKSHIYKRICAWDMFLPFEHADEGKVRPLLRLVAPSPCTLTTLGLAILEMYEYGIDKNLREHEIWRLVRAQVTGHKTSLIAIDEMHHVLIGRNRDERAKIAETLKNLMNGQEPLPVPKGSREAPVVLLHPPVQLFLTGMPSLRQFCRGHLQLKRRCRFVGLNPLAWPKGEKKIERFLEIIEEKLGFAQPSGLAAADMPLRFFIASNGNLGRIAQLVYDAACAVIDKGEPCIVPKIHLARGFEDAHGLGSRRNPFLYANPGDCPKVPEPTEEILTRLRGTKAEPEQGGDHE